jgi:hypothetical protein
LATVLRVANIKGDGPYHGKVSRALYERLAMDDDDAHPGPTEPGEPWENGFIPKNHFCAFLDRDQYTAWFPLDLRAAMAKEGYALYVLEVPDEHVALGNRQVTFDVRHARVLGEVSLLAAESLSAHLTA